MDELKRGRPQAEVELSLKTKLTGPTSPIKYRSIQSTLNADCMTAIPAGPATQISEKPMSRDQAELTHTPSNPSSQNLTASKELKTEPSAGGPHCWAVGEGCIFATCVTFAFGVTAALVLDIYIGLSQVYHHGVVVTDNKVCTDMGLKVLSDYGSSIDSAIAAALCLGIVSPHKSGIGGGGVILVHDVRNNKSKIIDFLETVPAALTAEMLQSDIARQPGLLVAVPGMLSGLHQAHQLYGRLQWKDVITRAANIAREGFRVSHDLAKALSVRKDQNVSERFKEMFIPNGEVLSPGSILRQRNLAAVLDRVANHGVAAFYHGSLAQEIASEVQARGGVLTVNDLSNYTTILRQPVEGNYQGYVVLVAPPPYAGAAVISVLNVIKELNLTRRELRRNVSHWLAESLRAALAMATGLGDPMFNSEISALLAKMTSKEQATIIAKMIREPKAYYPKHYSAFYSLQSEMVSNQVTVMGQDNLIVVISSSLNNLFGSQILTSSGVLLNNQILDFSWSNKTQDTTQFSPWNLIQPGKRPLSFLDPTIVRPSQGKCGTYVALGSSSGDPGFSAVTQVLVNVLSLQKNMSFSVASGRLHPLLQGNALLVDSRFGEEEKEALKLQGHMVHQVDFLSMVQGAERINDVTTGVTDPRSEDTLATNSPKPYSLGT